MWDLIVSVPDHCLSFYSAERQVAVYFLCGSGTMGLPSIIPYAEAECQTLNSHNILCAEAEFGT